MPDITQPPAQIGPISGASGQVENFGDFAVCVTAAGSFGGPFKIGSAIYQLQVTSVGTPVKIRCYKSLDEGLTWAEQFAGSAPTVDPTHAPLLMQAVPLPVAQSILVGYYADTGPTTGLQFATFVPGVGWSAGSFPTISADLRVNGGGQLLQSDFILAARSDDSVVVIYGNTDGANWHTVYRISSGGPWGSATVIATEGGSAPPGTIMFPNWLFPQATVDASDNVLGFLRQIDTGSVETYHFFKINAAGAIATAVTPIEAGRAGGRSCASTPRIFNNGLLFAVALGDSGVSPATTAAALYTGAPASAPVWPVAPQIFEAAHEELISIDVPTVQLFLDGVVRVLLAWLFQPRDGSAIEIRRSINSGSGWGVTGVFYDLLANPPNATPPADQFIDVFTGGDVGSVGAAISVVDPDLEKPIGFFLVPGDPAPPVPIPVFGPSPLTGGEASTPYVIDGCLIGVKRFKDC